MVSFRPLATDRSPGRPDEPSGEHHMNRRTGMAVAAALLVIAWASPARAQLTITPVPSSHDFGPVAIGTTSGQYTFVVQNTAVGHLVRVTATRCAGTSDE